MSVIVDTSVLVAWLNARDPQHARALAVMEAVLSHRHGTPLSTDAVLDEGLTFLRRKVRDRAVSEAFARLFFPGDEKPVLDWITTDQEVLARATRLHLQDFDRALSFTDCTLIEHARRMGALVATFDDRWGGLAARMPE